VRVTAFTVFLTSTCRRAAEIDERAARGKTVVLHLGNGSSMCAIAGGRSIASTMGFTAADGLPMGTRCGKPGPGVMLY
jgi:acetate kinase